ncbi:MAG: 3-isopropylmalate dehydrogenase [Deltaproteobacteria bacterium HGW-Deltaproteobacteria-14]|jgi:3-isopropylmalate dehydrogenase|nr:MAG: 3-isopropylmalate dehydrogenase [Deltaproteobacteria bacterium HGW-Deltaproteobacteria-14]
MTHSIVLLPGDGIGPEVVSAAKQVLDAVAERFGFRLAYVEHLIGGIAIDEAGDPLPDSTIDACRASDAVLLGAVGGPRWDDPKARHRPEQGLLGLRRGLGLYANLRPVRPYPSLAAASPLKADRLVGVDMLFVRELTGGIYFGQPRFTEDTRDGGRRAVDTCEYTDHEIRRIVRLAFSLAEKRRGKLTSVDKANVLATSRLWRKVVDEVAVDFQGVVREHRLVDSTAMRLVTHPNDFDVVVTENMFGDILSDEAAVFVGSLGLLPSASLGDAGPGVYEPIHGSAPDIAGEGIANPIGTILSVAMMLRHSLDREDAARAIEAAVRRVIEGGARTHDLGGELGTQAMTDRVLAALETP